MSSPANVSIAADAGSLTVTLSGRLSAETTGALWRQTVPVVERQRPRQLVIDAAEVSYCDGSGAGLLLHLQQQQQQSGGSCQLRGLAKEFAHLLDFFDLAALTAPAKPPRTSVAVRIGELTLATVADIRDVVHYTGQLTEGLLWGLLHPRRMRWRDALQVMEICGVNALPLVTVIGLLMGLILAFQATIPLQRFGAELLVAQLVSLSLMRELGPLMTGVILAGRTSSAFAAELGTMKVNEELDALQTMGLDPVRFLIVPRVLAAVLMTPLLAIYFIVVGLVGGGLVVCSLGFTVATYLDQVQAAVTPVDLICGVVKAVVFGILVIGIGCLRGLQTRSGASAVGASTTRAVVSSILLIAVADGIFSWLYYKLGL